MLVITKFNKLIRNRLLWAIFGILIGFIFVIYFIPGVGGLMDQSEHQPNAEGTLYGKDISVEEFRMAKFFETGLHGYANLPQKIVRTFANVYGKG